MVHRSTSLYGISLLICSTLYLFFFGTPVHSVGVPGCTDTQKLLLKGIHDLCKFGKDHRFGACRNCDSIPADFIPCMKAINANQKDTVKNFCAEMAIHCPAILKSCKTTAKQNKESIGLCPQVIAACRNP